MNAKYRALHEGLRRINDNLEYASSAVLPSPYTEEDADKIYNMMIEEIPTGTKVRVTYLPDAAKPTQLVTREGVVESHASISKREPDFHIHLAEGNLTILLPGSVLEAI